MYDIFIQYTVLYSSILERVDCRVCCSACSVGWHGGILLCWLVWFVVWNTGERDLNPEGCVHVGVYGCMMCVCVLCECAARGTVTRCNAIGGDDGGVVFHTLLIRVDIFAVDVCV